MSNKPTRAIGAEADGRYRDRLVDAASDWAAGTQSDQYQNYGKIIESLKAQTFESQVEANTLWVGTPDEIAGMIERYNFELGGFEIASLQVNFYRIPKERAEASMRLFSQEVMPRFVSGQYR